MKLHTTASASSGLRYKTKQRLAMASSPLCGIMRNITFVARARQWPRMMSVSSDLAKLQFLFSPSVSFSCNYHIASSGIYMDETLIRLIGESVERYSLVSAGIYDNREEIIASYDQMIKRNKAVITPDKLRFFSEEQLKSSGLPYQLFDPSVPISWTNIESLVSNTKVFVPTQLLMFVRQRQLTANEPCIYPTMSTGTASHLSFEQAMRNALLEVIQIDSAMGHWYSDATAKMIKLDKRTQAVENFIQKHSNTSGPQPSFYWLPNPDLPGFYIACILKQSGFPKIAIGLGADTSLGPALYKAYIETHTILSFVRVQQVNEKSNIKRKVTDPNKICNLDDNVVFYANGGNNQLIHEKFPPSKTINASKLPPDMKGDATSHIKNLIDGFRKTGKELVYKNFSGCEASALGLVVCRVWSPDTLSLSLPSFPPMQHHRFRMYKGIAHEHPHPYP